MLSVDDALLAVMERARPLPPRRVSLLDALNGIAAEPVAADRDSPPFPKALVDGYAVRSSDLAGPGPHRLAIGEEVAAGRTPSRPLAAREAALVMTGAPLPDGCDAVVMHEKTRRDGGFILIPGPVLPQEGRLPRGREMRAGDVVIEAGRRLGPASLGVLASVGRAEVMVIPRPRVAIVPTGDELVPVSEVPGPGQIRESNGTVLAAMVRSAGCEAVVHPAARDDLGSLSRVLTTALDEADVVLVCGGVSAGNYDLVPEALRSVGVDRVFHKVRLKPGKPLFFGVGPAGVPLVFGLPGNPVSGLIGFLLFVGPALRAMQGMGASPCPSASVRLATPYCHRGDRRTYHPARKRDQSYEPLAWAGSADLLTVSRADGFLIFPEGDRDYESGARIDMLSLPCTPAIPDGWGFQIPEVL